MQEGDGIVMTGWSTLWVYEAANQKWPIITGARWSSKSSFVRNILDLVIHKNMCNQFNGDSSRWIAMFVCSN